MPIVTRRKLLQLGTVSLLGDIIIPSGKRPSAEERLQLTNAMEANIVAGWKMFHTTNMDLMLGLGQAQLFLLRQIQANLHPYVLAIHFSGVYRLIGAILYMQGHHYEAHKFQKKAYTAASEGNNAWNMAQTLKAYRLMALGQHSDVIEIAEAALQLITHQDDTENIRLRARLLAFGAENAILTGTLKGAETRLDASKALLDFLPAPHEEFDRERDASITMAEKAVSLICSINASSQYKQLMGFIQEDLLPAFPGDKKARDFVANTQLMLPGVAPSPLLPT